MYEWGGVQGRQPTSPAAPAASWWDQFKGGAQGAWQDPNNRKAISDAYGQYYQAHQKPTVTQQPLSPEQRALFQMQMGSLRNPAFLNNAANANASVQGQLSRLQGLSWEAPKTSTGASGYGGGYFQPNWRQGSPMAPSGPSGSPTDSGGFVPKSRATQPQPANVPATPGQWANPFDPGTSTGYSPFLPQDPGAPPRIHKSGNFFSRLGGALKGAAGGAMGGASGGTTGAYIGAVTGTLGYKESEEQKWRASKDARKQWEQDYLAFLAAGGQPSYTGKGAPKIKK